MNSSAKNFRRRPLVAALIGILATALSPHPVQAAALTWSGYAGQGGNWDARAYSFGYAISNWNDNLLPVNGDSLIFSSANFTSTNLISTNNTFTNLNVSGLSFVASAGAFTLAGNALGLSGDIINNSSKLQTINMALNVTGHSIWDGGASGILVNEKVTLGNYNLTLKNKVQLGGTLSNFTSYIGKGITELGEATVTGVNSSWNSSGNLYVGSSGKGVLNILNGGQVANAQGYLSYFGGSQGDALVSGAGSRWTSALDLKVGVVGKGQLDIEDGGEVLNQSGYLGYSDGGFGVANVGGTGSRWVNSANLTIGLGGDAMLNVSTGGIVDVGNVLNLGAEGILNLDGGKLSAGAANLAAGGQFDWSSGTLIITGYGGASLGHDSLLDAVTVVGSGKVLDVTHTLALDAEALLVLQGSGRIKAGSLTLAGGMFKVGSLNFADIASISGYGSVAGNVFGGDSTNSLRAGGGTLILGNANSASGYDFNGVLEVGSNRVILLDQDQAHLGVSTTLAEGGRLVADKGLYLGIGETLTFTGNASILGDFGNDGSVSGTDGTLTLLSDVSGAGSFAGTVLFRAAYNPGNSPAIIDFQGGNATFDANSVLNMEIFGATPGTQYDRLTGINLLTFNGTLNLVFSDGFTPSAGSSFDLFDFVSLSGDFDANRISVTGYDREQLDFSRLSSEGTLSVITTPVPEPETYALFLIGLGLLGLRRHWAAK